MHVKILDIDGNILVTLPEGHHTIGRSTKLKCNSKQVSRKQATITIDQDEAILSAIHINPCYYKAAQSNNTMILKENNESRLYNNDKFGFLPEKYWYQVEFINDEKIESKYGNENETTASTTVILMNDSQNGDETNASKKIKLDNGADITMDDSFSFVDHSLCVTMKIDEINEFNDTIDSEQSIDATQPSTSKLTDERDQPSTSNNNKQLPSTSNDNQQLTSKDDNQPPIANGDSKNEKQRRERCWYAADCYRKNPQHRQEFSHPDDADYASDPEDNRPVCTFGAACYRRNKIHRRDFKHPTGPLPRKMVGKKRTATAKKAADLDETPEDDYDYEDPFIDDGDSDEYVVDSNDDDDSDLDNPEEEDSEEVKRLLKEAKRFTANPK